MALISQTPISYTAHQLLFQKHLTVEGNPQAYRNFFAMLSFDSDVFMPNITSSLRLAQVDVAAIMAITSLVSWFILISSM